MKRDSRASECCQFLRGSPELALDLGRGSGTVATDRWRGEGDPAAAAAAVVVQGNLVRTTGFVGAVAPVKFNDLTLGALELIIILSFESDWENL